MTFMRTQTVKYNERLSPFKKTVFIYYKKNHSFIFFIEPTPTKYTYDLNKVMGTSCQSFDASYNVIFPEFLLKNTKQTYP